MVRATWTGVVVLPAGTSVPLQATWVRSASAARARAALPLAAGAECTTGDTRSVSEVAAMKAFGFALCGCLAVAGCTVETTSGPPPAPVVVTGTVVLDWTINGSKDPDQCDQGAATTLDVLVHTTRGAFVGEFQEACSSFATSIELDPGSYVADAVLLDANGVERTTSVPIDPFTVQGADTLDLPIDFPARSFR